MPASDQFDIRKLSPQDARAFWHLRLEALEREPAAFADSPEQHREMAIEAAARNLSSDPDNNFVVGAFANNGLVAMAGFFRNRGAKIMHKGRIWGVYVKDEFRRKGIGQALLSALLRWARCNPGLEQISLTVTVQQTAAKQLYESLGFKIYGREERALRIDDTYLDEYLMALQLSPGTIK